MKKKNLPPQDVGTLDQEDIKTTDETLEVGRDLKETKENPPEEKIQVREEKLDTKTESESVDGKHKDNLSSFFEAEEEKKLESFWFQTLSTKQFISSMTLILLVSFIYIGFLFYLLSPNSLNDVSFLLGNRKNNSYQNPLTNTPSSFILELSNPEDNSLVFDNSIIVSGNVNPNSNVLISSNDYDHGLEIGSNGQFSQVFTLAPGLNIINVSAFDESGNSKSLLRSVYYSTEKL